MSTQLSDQSDGLDVCLFTTVADKGITGLTLDRILGIYEH